MPNYKLLIEYDGTQFHGWQFQPKLRTVQGELEKAIATITKEEVRLNCAGRTDRGVHALEQVANFKIPSEWQINPMRHSINGITGRDVVVHSIEEVPEDFHARYKARARQYLYYLILQPVAVGRQYAYYNGFPLNIAAMQEAAHCLYGEHHFEAFSQKMPEEKHYLCRIDLISWKQEGNRIAFRIRANRFLHSMVRCIMGTLVQVGRGKLTPEAFQDILESRQRQHSGFKAPPHGLFLEKVFY